MLNQLSTIGMSGLNAAQYAINITGHNIANANATGYHRQVVDTSALAAQKTTNGFVGTGVNVDTVRRMYSEFLDTQVLQIQNAKSDQDIYAEYANQLDLLMASTESTLSPALQNFFNNIQNVNTSGTDKDVTRSGMLTSASALSDQFNMVDERINEIRRTINQDFITYANTVTGYAAQISDVNRKIIEAGVTKAAVPNDLVDQRDKLLTELNDIVGIKSINLDNGTVNVMIGGSMPLVSGLQTYAVVAKPNPDNTTENVLGYLSVADSGRYVSAEEYAKGKLVDGRTISSASTFVPIPTDRLSSGGKFSGMLRFRDEILNATQNNLGRIALSVAVAINNQQRLGMDLYGNTYGQTGFSDIFKFDLTDSTVDPDAMFKIITGAKNQSVAYLTGVVDSIQNLTNEDYKLVYTNGEFRVLNPATNLVMSDAVLSGTGTKESPYRLSVGGKDIGITLTLNGDTPVEGDSFLIQPTRLAAGTIQLATTDQKRIASALPPIVAQKTTTGTGSTSAVSAISVNSINALVDITAKEVTDDQGNTTLVFDATDANGNLLAKEVPITANSTTTPPTVQNVSFNGWTYQFTDAPANGDKFTVENGVMTRTAGTAPATEIFHNPVTDNVKIVFDSETTPPTKYNIVDKDGNVIVKDVTFEQGKAITFNGWKLVVNGTPQAGEELEVNPTGSDALSVKSSLDTSSTLKFASKASKQSFDPNLLNQSTLTFTAGDAGAYQYSVSDGKTTSTGTYTPGQSITYNGWKVTLSGVVADGDTFTIGGSAGVDINNPLSINLSKIALDNRNTVKMANLQSTRVMAGGTMTFGEAHAQMVGEVGNSAKKAISLSESQAILLANAEAAQQSVSGVSLDEEAANLLRFQQYYQASAKIIQVSNTVFDSILGIVR